MLELLESGLLGSTTGGSLGSSLAFCLSHHVVESHNCAVCWLLPLHEDALVVDRTLKVFDGSMQVSDHEVHQLQEFIVILDRDPLLDVATSYRVQVLRDF